MSTKSDIDISYGISNDFYRIWLDKRMTYTCGIYKNPKDDLETAQTAKLEHHYKAARVTPKKRVLDIGCGWGSNLAFLAEDKRVKNVTGITLSRDQYNDILAKKIPNTTTECVSYLDYHPASLFDAIISIGMFEHIATPEDVRNNRHIDIYRRYFELAWEWSTPGAWFSLQSVIGAKIPRGKHLRELAWATYTIFPGAITPRLDAILEAASPRWEAIEIITRREHYAKTTAHWLERLNANQTGIVTRWGQKLFDDYQRYLSACIMAFEQNYQSLVQIAFKRID